MFVILTKAYSLGVILDIIAASGCNHLLVHLLLDIYYIGMHHERSKTTQT